jgi:hypothetical protein
VFGLSSPNFFGAIICHREELITRNAAEQRALPRDQRWSLQECFQAQKLA